jgi:hypothetical protein
MPTSLGNNEHSNKTKRARGPLDFRPHSSTRVDYRCLHRHRILTRCRAGEFYAASPALTLLPVAALMMQEAREFEMIDALPPFDDCGNVAWIFEGEPTSRREKR